MITRNISLQQENGTHVVQEAPVPCNLLRGRKSPYSVERLPSRPKEQAEGNSRAIATGLQMLDEHEGNPVSLAKRSLAGNRLGCGKRLLQTPALGGSQSAVRLSGKGIFSAIMPQFENQGPRSGPNTAPSPRPANRASAGASVHCSGKV